MNTKECTNCNVVKPLSAFNKRKKDSADGHKGKCRECEKEYDSARREARKEKFADIDPRTLKSHKSCSGCKKIFQQINLI